MSGTENNQAGTLDERLRLGAGFAAADRPRILRALSALAPHLSGWEHDQVDLEVSLKDTEGPDQKVTLQAWLAGRAHLVATSHERDLDHALADVRRDLIRQIEEEVAARASQAPEDPLSDDLIRVRGFGGALYRDPAVVPVGGQRRLFGLPADSSLSRASHIDC